MKSSDDPIYIKSMTEYLELVEATNDKPMVIDFTASWCPPCKRIGPIFVAKMADYPELVMKKVDVDEQKDIVELTKIQAFPEFKVYKDGKVVDSLTGANEGGLETLLQKAKALVQVN